MPNSPRDREIKRWLRQHPSVVRFVIIDDEANELDELPLFQTSGKDGLSPKIVRGVERYLAGKSDKTMPANFAKRFLQDASAKLSPNKR